jgi:hypothetical protein
MSSAYPDGCGPADIPGCSPDRQMTDGDAEYDLFRERCDAGEACALCMYEGRLERVSPALGIELWRCPQCSAEHFR